MEPAFNGRSVALRHARASSFVAIEPPQGLEDRSAVTASHPAVPKRRETLIAREALPCVVLT